MMHSKCSDLTGNGKELSTQCELIPDPPEDTGRDEAKDKKDDTPSYGTCSTMVAEDLDTTFMKVLWECPWNASLIKP